MLLKIVASVIALVKGYTVKIAELEAELLKAKESGIATDTELKAQVARSEAAEAKVIALEEAELAEDADEAAAIEQLTAIMAEANPAG